MSFNFQIVKLLNARLAIWLAVGNCSDINFLVNLWISTQVMYNILHCLLQKMSCFECSLQEVHRLTLQFLMVWMPVREAFVLCRFCCLCRHIYPLWHWCRRCWTHRKSFLMLSQLSVPPGSEEPHICNATKTCRAVCKGLYGMLKYSKSFLTSSTIDSTPCISSQQNHSSSRSTHNYVTLYIISCFMSIKLMY